MLATGATVRNAVHDMATGTTLVVVGASHRGKATEAFDAGVTITTELQLNTALRRSLSGTGV